MVSGHSSGSTGGNAAGGVHVVHLVHREGLSSVFNSQVLAPMEALSAKGFQVQVAVFTTPGQWLRRELRARWGRVATSISPTVLRRVVRLPSFPSRITRPELEAILFKYWLRASRRRREDPLIVQCRNSRATGMALQVRRALPELRVIFDCRGASDHEFLYGHGLAFDSASISPELMARALELSREQRVAALESDAVFCVSEAMVDHLVREYGIRRDKCTVVPCCVDMDRFRAGEDRREERRRALGLEGRFVVAYCGSLARYQLPERTLELFGRIQRLEPSATFLAVTTQPDAMRAAADAAKVPAEQITIVSVPHQEVPSYLAAADVGLLLRERSAVNAVASPVKFGEYLSSGTPVILSEGIGDYSELTARKNLGLVLGLEWTEDQLEARLRKFIAEYFHDPQRYRVRCREAAVRYLSLACYSGRVADVYRRLV